MGHQHISWSQPATKHAVVVLDDGAETLSPELIEILPKDVTAASIGLTLSNDAGFAEIMGTAHGLFEVLESEEFVEKNFDTVAVLARGAGIPLAVSALRVRPEAFDSAVLFDLDPQQISADPMMATLDSPNDGPGPRPLLVVTDQASVLSMNWLVDHTLAQQGSLEDVTTFLSTTGRKGARHDEKE